jgi:UDPglucose--hexose-1-phosphate uridylyltransferase
VPDIADVFASYRERIIDLDKDVRFQHIYVFKNVGPSAGASLVHAHSQLVALPLVPPAIEGKLFRAHEHYRRKQRSLFKDILHTEREDGSRLVAENDGYVLFCPFASRFPFELAIFPKRHHGEFISCTTSELQDLAEVLRFAIQRLNGVLEKPGYNFLLHMAPLTRPGTQQFASSRYDYCWHLEIVPRFNALAGFEIGLGAYINTVYPEEAARFLRGEART